MYYCNGRRVRSELNLTMICIAKTGCFTRAAKEWGGGGRGSVESGKREITELVSVSAEQASWACSLAICEAAIWSSCADWETEALSSS